MSRKQPVHTDNRLFNGTWSFLHLIAAAQCAMIFMHLGSSRYHWMRATTKADDDA